MVLYDTCCYGAPRVKFNTLHQTESSQPRKETDTISLSYMAGIAIPQEAKLMLNSGHLYMLCPLPVMFSFQLSGCLTSEVSSDFA